MVSLFSAGSGTAIFVSAPQREAINLRALQRPASLALPGELHTNRSPDSRMVRAQHTAGVRKQELTFPIALAQKSNRPCSWVLPGPTRVVSRLDSRPILRASAPVRTDK